MLGHYRVDIFYQVCLGTGKSRNVGAGNDTWVATNW